MIGNTIPTTLQVFSRLPLLLQTCVTIFVGLVVSLYFGWALALVLLLFAPLMIGWVSEDS